MQTLGSMFIHETFMKELQVLNPINLNISVVFKNEGRTYLNEHINASNSPVISQKKRSKYKTYEELLELNNLKLDRCLYHVNSGGYAMIFKSGYFIAKIIPTNNFTQGYYVPVRIITEIRQYPMNSFITSPYGITTNVNMKKFTELLTQMITFISMCVAYIEQKDIDSKNILTDISLKHFFINNREYPPIISKLIQQVFKQKIQLSLFNNFHNLASFHSTLQNLTNSTIIYIPIAVCSANKFTKPNYSSQLFFQVLLSYYLIEKHYNERFVHHDLKLDNILVYEDTTPIMINITINNVEKKYMICNKFKFKINDFDLSKIKETSSNEWFVDLHFFVHSVIHYGNFEVSEEIKNFCMHPVCGTSCNTQKRWLINYDGSRYVTLENLGDFIINTFQEFENDF